MTEMTYGEWLQMKRKESGLSLEALAEKANNVCSGSYINRLELGTYKSKKGEKQRPRLVLVEALADALDVPRAEARLMAGYPATGETFDSIASQLAAEYVEGTDHEKREDALAFLDFWRQRYPAAVASDASKPDEGEPEEVDKPSSDATMTDPARGSGANGKEKAGTSDKRGTSKKRAGRK